MQLQIAASPDHYMPINGNTKIKYDIVILDSNSKSIIFKESNSRTIDDLNSVLSQLENPKSEYYEVSLSIDYYDSNKRTFIPCMEISGTSELLNRYNDGVDRGVIFSNPGRQNFQRNINYGELYLYLIPEDIVKNLIDWENEKYNVDVDSLTNRILELEATVSLAKQELTSKKKLATEVVYSQNDILGKEKYLGKLDIYPLQDLYNAYTLLPTGKMDDDLRKRYNAFMLLVKQWNILADQLGFNFIK